MHRPRALVLGLACAGVALVPAASALSAGPRLQASSAPQAAQVAEVSAVVKGKNFAYTQCPLLTTSANKAPHKDCVKQPVVAPTEAFATFKASDKQLGASAFDAYLFFEDQCDLIGPQPAIPATVVGNPGKFTVLSSRQFPAPGKYFAVVLVQLDGSPPPILTPGFSSCLFDSSNAIGVDLMVVDVKWKFDKKYSS